MLLPIRTDDRLVILGAGGWFGRSFLRLVHASIPVLRMASSRREDLIEWDYDTIRGFAPTVVVNFAFLTRDWVEREGEETFRKVNRQLLERFAVTAEIPGVRSVLTVSSGAALDAPDSPYGSMKIAEETLARDLAVGPRAVVVARCYSVSGPFVRRPRSYAFSDLILQARSGTVRVSSDRLTFRRYTDVQDYLSVCIRHALAGWSGTIESGGELMEMGELAERVVSEVNPSAQILRPPLCLGPASVYASDNSSWANACMRMAFWPRPLVEQIRYTDENMPPETS